MQSSRESCGKFQIFHKSQKTVVRLTIPVEHCINCIFKLFYKMFCNFITLTYQFQFLIYFSLLFSCPSQGVGSLLARFQLTEGPSKPAPVVVQFTSEGSTLSGCDIELVGLGYRFSLIKKRFAAGNFNALSWFLISVKPYKYWKLIFVCTFLRKIPGRHLNNMIHSSLHILDQLRILRTQDRSRPWTVLDLMDKPL